MSSHDLIVIGAGPAGTEAALTAQSRGLDVIIIDEAVDAGGQIYRAGPASRVPEGERLRETIRNSRVRAAYEHRVWTALKTESSFEVASAGPNGSAVFSSKALIVCSGAIERFYPRPGWTLPGVIGLGAATIMLKAQGILPGQRVLVSGPGPLAPLVAHLVQEHGGNVVALVDPNPRSLWLKSLTVMASRPDLLAQGAKWVGQLLAKRVPVLPHWDIESFHGTNSVEAVTVRANLNPQQRRKFAVDAVCFGSGLYPATEFYKLLGARIDYAAERGGWIPVLDEHQRTSVLNLYAAGDGAELLGVTAAPLTGRIAGLTAAFDLKKIDTTEYQQEYVAAQAQLKRAARFGRAVARMMQPRASAMRDVPEQTIVCRCEDVTLAALRSAITAGAQEINALKAATRCGMGPCGGRMCGEAAAAVMECAGIRRENIGCWTARPPLRPVGIDVLTGAFEYSDIPIREPAPL
jgi:thioredoxin reductase/bacterioferritin-associated ferredoxin